MPGEGNMVADALRRKVYCNKLNVQESQLELCKEFGRLNLYLTNSGER